jgi:cobalt-zinc-cadmium efflux system membrane fusion protein
MKRCRLPVFGLALALLLAHSATGVGQQPEKKPSLRDELKVGGRYHFVPAGHDFFEQRWLVEVLALDGDWVKIKSPARDGPFWINLNQVGAIKATEGDRGDDRTVPGVKAIAATGAIAYDQTRVARLSAGVPCTVWRLEKAVGQTVLKNDVLALVNAPDVGKAKAEFLAALVAAEVAGTGLERLRSAGDAVPAGRKQQAENEHRLAQVRLGAAWRTLVNRGLPIPVEDLKGLAADEAARRVQFLGLPDGLSKALDAVTTTANLLALRAPLGGVVVAQEVVLGEGVDASKTLFVVADTSRMWLTLHVPLADARHVALGQEVRFRADGGTADLVGKISWVSTAVDEGTRTVPVRAVLANPDGRLRANTFGVGRILVNKVKD